MKTVIRPIVMLLSCVCLHGWAWRLCAQNDAKPELSARASWRLPSRQDSLEQGLKSIQEADLEETVRESMKASWKDRLAQDDADVIDAFVAVASAGNPSVEKITQAWNGAIDPAKLPNVDSLRASVNQPFVGDQLRLFIGRRLIQAGRLEEGLPYLAGLQTDQVLDPAALLFYRGLAEHQLLKRDDAIQSLKTLQEHKESIPKRFSVLSQRMLAEMTSLEDDSLDHISRRMRDIRRRLGLGQAGPNVRKIEDGVIDSLDKLIKEMEDRQNQRMASMSPSGGGIRSSSPAQDSMPLGGKGPGRVNKKDLEPGGAWGALNPKEREAVLQQIGEDFPSHYREVIQEYFKKLAQGER